MTLMIVLAALALGLVAMLVQSVVVRSRRQRRRAERKERHARIAREWKFLGSAFGPRPRRLTQRGPDDADD